METHLEICTENGVIRGMKHSPTSHKKKKASIIIIHGYFSATRVGPARLYLQVARFLSERGYTIYRFDLLGVGDSDGDTEDITFESEVRDVNYIYEFVKADLVENKIILLGHSMGANLALHLSSNENLNISRLILIAPEVEKKDGIDQLFTKKELRELKQKGAINRKGIHINLSFIEEIRSLRIFETAKHIHIPVSVIHGGKDELYEISGSEKLASVCSNGTFVLIEDADHNFLNPKHRKKLFFSIVSFLSKFNGLKN